LTGEGLSGKTKKKKVFEETGECKGEKVVFSLEDPDSFSSPTCIARTYAGREKNTCAPEKREKKGGGAKVKRYSQTVLCESRHPGLLLAPDGERRGSGSKKGGHKIFAVARPQAATLKRRNRLLVEGKIEQNPRS